MATHEQGNFDMKAIVQASREQREKQRPAQTKTAQATASVEATHEATDIASASHGDYVTAEDGVGAIVIDHEEQLRKMRANDKTGNALMNLVDPNSLISDANAYVPEYGEDAPEGYDPGTTWIEENPYDPKTKTLKDIKKGFSTLTYGLKGLVEESSPEGQMVNEALEKVRTGEVVLPTPEEYEEQKRQAAERKKARRAKLEGKETPESEKKDSEQKESKKTEQKTLTVKNRSPKKEDESELKMAEMPENATIKKGAVEQMSENITNVTPVTPVTKERTAKAEAAEKVETTNAQEVAAVSAEPARKNTKKVAPPVVDEYPEEELAEGVDEEAVEGEVIENSEEEETGTPAPLNLVDLKEELEGEYDEEAAEAAPKEEVVPPVVIKVPEGEANNVIAQLPLSTYDKIVRSKTVEIREVEMKEVPTASRRVDSIAEYRALKNKRASVRSGEVTERALLNSGFVITLKSATSLEMSTIFKTMMGNETDTVKMYQFCYEHTVDTSIGKLSYNEFVSKVDPKDIETVLDGIYEISEVDERKVQIMCGMADGGCGGFYDVQFEVKNLPCVDRLPEKSRERVKEILAVRNDLDAARRVQMASPVMNVKILKFGDRYVYVRSTNGHMLIEREPIIEEIGNEYGAFIALLIIYVEKIVVEYSVREDVPPESVDLVTPELICEELKTLEDAELEALKNLISDGLTDYQPVQYSIKGHFQCPNCGATKSEIDCKISDLIFQKVQRMLE